MYHRLSIDIETYSSVDLKECGVYKYAASPDFQVQLLTYSVDGAPRVTVDLAGKIENLPTWFLEALLDPEIRKEAFNASFERICLSSHYGVYLAPRGWFCTLVKSQTHGIGGKLDLNAKVLQLDTEKMASGMALINYFAKPCLPTIKNGGRTRNYPFHDPEKWAEYSEYNSVDVQVEQELGQVLNMEPTGEFEDRMYWLDQKINDFGVGVDMEMALNAIQFDIRSSAEMIAESKRISGLANPNSTKQLTEWLQGRGIVVSKGITKDSRPDLLAQAATLGDPEVKRVLEIDMQISKASVKKYQAIERYAIQDHTGQHRIRGMFLFYGALRTGRFAGRGVQLQNLTKNSLPDEDLAIARRMIKTGDYEGMRAKFDSVSSVLSQILRTVFIPYAGHRYYVADFSAIEARILAWIADEKWRLEVFAGHGKIYEASASRMFNIPLEEITKSHPARAKGKIAELALGYNGGTKALTSMDNKNELDEPEKERIVKAWRAASPAITQFWNDIQNAAFAAIREYRTTHIRYGLEISYSNRYLMVKLPSGRKLMYFNARIESNGKFGRPEIQFESGTSKGWRRDEGTYGGKLTENIIQAIARDCLCEAMIRLDDRGYPITMHVHDEVVIEMPTTSTEPISVMEGILAEPIAWAPGLHLPAEGYITEYYTKD